VSDLRAPGSVLRPKCEKTSNDHRPKSAMRHPIDFMSGSRLGLLARTDYIALFNLTAHELHERYYDRPTT